MLRIRELRKTYPGGVQALRGIDLDVPSGVFGLLGPNGSGKTTLMKIAATLLDPDVGSVTFDDLDIVRHKTATRRMLGYLPQEFGLYPVLTAEQTLDYFARLKGVVGHGERRALVGALLERVNLSHARRQKLRDFSGGMRQRLGIAQALIGRPRLIIVDEPTAGLDPEERARFHSLFSEIADQDTTVILSTHIVSDISHLCGRMAIIRYGEIVSSCTPKEALAGISGAVWEADVPREDVPALRSRLRVISSRPLEGRARLRVHSKAPPSDQAFEPAIPTLEDYYFICAGPADRER